MLHQHFRTPAQGGGIRSYYLAKALVEHNINVCVITAHDQPFKKEVIEGIEVHYLNVPYDNAFGFLKRVYSFLLFVIKAIWQAASIKNVAVCYAISTPLTIGLIARWLKFRHNIPYIFEVGDLWPEAPIQMGFIQHPLLKWYTRLLEKRIYHGALSIVAMSPDIEGYIKKITKTPIVMVPNMADTDFFILEEKRQTLELKYNVANKIVVSYVGAMGLANGLDYLIDCARISARANLPIHFLLAGDGALRERLKQTSASLRNISLLPFTNRDGVKEILNVTDVAFVCYKALPVLETGSPNKFFDGLAAGKLIATNFGGWIADEIQTHQCGFAANAHHPTDFIKKIQPFIESKELLMNYQHRSRKLAEEKYSRRKLTQVLVNLILQSNKN